MGEITQRVMDAYSLLIRKRSVDGVVVGGNRFVKYDYNGEKVLAEWTGEKLPVIYDKLKF